MEISGICSSHTEDSDGEFLDPTGFDFAPLLEKGFFNWNHQANKDASAILGRPTEASVVNGGRDFHVKGYLYKGSDQAKAVYQLAQVLENEDPTRRLGFSIEGQALERDPINKKRVRKARITGIAITHCPKNANTLLSIMKGEYAEPFVEVEETKTCPKCDHNQLVVNTGTCLECGYVEKAMGVNIDINPESVEGKPKDQVNSDTVNFLTKSDIYNRIFDRYTDNIQKTKEIYKLVEKTAEKLYNMEGKELITEDVLQKAFGILDSSIELKKAESEETTTTTTTEEPETEKEVITKSEDQEALQKSAAMETLAKSCIENGMNKGETMDEMVKGGYSAEECQGCVEKVIREFQAKKDGGDITVIAKSLEAAFIDRLEKSDSATESLLQGLAAGLDEKFTAIANVLRKSNDDSALIVTDQEEIKKSLEGMNTLLEKIGSEPFPKKSATHVIPNERFAKSLAGETTGEAYELSKAEDRAYIGDRLLAKAQDLQRIGKPDAELEKAIMDLEITKSLPQSAVMTLANMGVQVVN